MELTVLWEKTVNKQIKYKGECWKDDEVLATEVGLRLGRMLRDQTTAMQEPGEERGIGGAEA